MGWDAFMSGFLSQTNENIKDRKDEARDYYNKKMELAFDKVQQFRSKNAVKLQSTMQTAQQLKSIGVPDYIIKGIANQNPDDLATFYEEAQRLKFQGVNMNEQSYQAMSQIHQEIGDPEESISSFLSRIYEPLVANVNSNKEGFEFDPKGTFWATAMGYNAMEKANQKLANTEVMPGVNAADALSYNGQPNIGLYGNRPVSINAEWIGQQTRNATEANKGQSPLTPGAIKSINDSYEGFLKEERSKLSLEDRDGKSPEEIDELARPSAAARTIELYGSDVVSQIPTIYKYIDSNQTVAPESPSEAPTQPVAPTATPAPEQSQSLPQGVPEGSRLVREWPNGDRGYEGPDGKKYIVKKNPTQTSKVSNPDIQALEGLIKYSQGN